jgi:hypothetical protein
MCEEPSGCRGSLRGSSRHSKTLRSMAMAPGILTLGLTTRSRRDAAHSGFTAGDLNPRSLAFVAPSSGAAVPTP